MGTRADFYVGRGETAEWIGSITWDGYPGGIDEAVFAAETEEDHRAKVAEFFAPRNDVTLPSEPWPWPWENSQTTDYAYAFAGGAVFGSCFGNAWFKVDPEAEDFGQIDSGDAPKVPFPDMSDRKGDINHIMAKSGMIIVSLPGSGGGS